MRIVRIINICKKIKLSNCILNIFNCTNYHISKIIIFYIYDIYKMNFQSKNKF